MAQHETKARRTITATNRDLEAQVARKQFREDLYYRINVVAIPLPPLRERRDDILTLAQHFIEQQWTCSDDHGA
ncbi:MAG TPA: sigma 54-interacting transcriptional regulator [Kofleriaceae bacterium]|jgi:transcriptional regulator with GAF, ATPase, and Fis domain